MSRADTEAQVHNSEPSPGLFGRISSRDYRGAVAQIVREIKAERGYTNERLAEILGCSETTVYNAENENGNLDGVTMLNLGAMCGGMKRLRRIEALVNGNPPEPRTEDDELADIELRIGAFRARRVREGAR